MNDLPVFISPHDDDFALFGAFTCIREQPIVVIVYDGYVQGNRGLRITADERKRETEAACVYLSRGEPIPIIRLGFRDDDASVNATDIRMRVEGAIPDFGSRKLFAPANEENGHQQHNLVAAAFGMPACVPYRMSMWEHTYYLTYTRTPNGKSVSHREVEPDNPSWVGSKLRSLACFQSQFLPAAGCVEHFIGRSLREYYL